MITNNKSQHLSSAAMAVILLAFMYSFGTFGFLNLFGVRVIVQAFLIATITLLLIVMRVRFSVTHFYPLIVFAVTYSIGSMVYSGSIARISDMYILIFSFVLIFYAPPKHVIFFSKILVVATTILCGLVFTAFIYYQIYPSEISRANFGIYGSSIGSKRIYTGHFMDFISFTSGEGFNFMGYRVTRMKGYSNEPSSTIVHYLAPAALAFILGGRFLYLGVFILCVNIVAIGSFIAYIIMILTFVFLFMKFIPKKISTILLFIGFGCFLFFLANPDIVLAVFRFASAAAIDYAGLDLLSRKIGDGTTDSSLGERNLLIVNGLKFILTSPVGYSEEKFGSGLGLFYMISSRAGWIGILIFSVFMLNLIKNMKAKYNKTSSVVHLFGLSLMASILLVTLFISGYGWSRPPGIVMLLLYFRYLQLDVAKNSALPRYWNRRFVYN
jgi:hypothetical protein